MDFTVPKLIGFKLIQYLLRNNCELLKAILYGQYHLGKNMFNIREHKQMFPNF